MGYRLPFSRWHRYVSTISPKWVRMFVILLINQEIYSFGTLHTIFVPVKPVSQWIYITIFYLFRHLKCLNISCQWPCRQLKTLLTHCANRICSKVLLKPLRRRLDKLDVGVSTTMLNPHGVSLDRMNSSVIGFYSDRLEIFRLSFWLLGVK